MKPTLLLLWCVLLYSCNILSESQSKAVQSFAGSVDSASTIPKQGLTQFAEVRYGVLSLELSLPRSEKESIPELDKWVDQKRASDQMLKDSLSGFNVLHLYAKTLLALSDDKYLDQLKGSADSLGIIADTALAQTKKLFGADVPKGLGTILTTVIKDIGALRLRKLQKKYLRKLLDGAQHSVDTLCDIYINHFSPIYIGAIQLEEKQAGDSYLNFLISNEPLDKLQHRMDYYITYNPIYLNWRKQLEDLMDMLKKGQDTFKKIKDAHAKLDTAIQRKETVGQALGALRDLYNSVQQAKSSNSKDK